MARFVRIACQLAATSPDEPLLMAHCLECGHVPGRAAERAKIRGPGAACLCRLLLLDPGSALRAVRESGAPRTSRGAGCVVTIAGKLGHFPGRARGAGEDPGSRAVCADVVLLDPGSALRAVRESGGASADEQRGRLRCHYRETGHFPGRARRAGEDPGSRAVCADVVLLDPGSALRAVRESGALARASTRSGRHG